VLLGNAGEFLDPIFSSGVTIAMKSASLATRAVDRQLDGEAVDWDAEFSRPLAKGIDTFRTYVAAWYDGSLQRIIFNQPRNGGEVTRAINAVLAGYAWDDGNPFVRDPGKYLTLLDSLCAA
jgi:flavin-dependent dehydrogenase